MNFLEVLNQKSEAAVNPAAGSAVETAQQRLITQVAFDWDYYGLPVPMTLRKAKKLGLDILNEPDQADLNQSSNPVVHVVPKGAKVEAIEIPSDGNSCRHWRRESQWWEKSGASTLDQYREMLSKTKYKEFLQINKEN